jgi:endonuclease YncB( thermonuclease family)
MDGTLLNAEIIKQGDGFTYKKYPFNYMEEFRGYEREARENRRGLWKE